MSYPTDDEIPLGIELLPTLGASADERAPARLTVDVYMRDARGERVERWQVTGFAVDRHERTVQEIARTIMPRTAATAEEVAQQLHELDVQAARDIAARLRRLRRDQTRILHGPETLAWLDEEHAADAAREQQEESNG